MKEEKRESLTPVTEQYRRASLVWSVYEDYKTRGHTSWCRQGRRNEQMYWGAGLQWTDEEKAILASEGRPYYEFNEIAPAIDSALAQQLGNKMDITFLPAGGNSDAVIAKALNKTMKHIAHMNQLHQVEHNVFANGIIMGRGFAELGLSFEKSQRGHIFVRSTDPLDVMIDPDAKSLDPDTWKRVLIKRWWTADEIEAAYGPEKRREVEQREQAESDFGVSDDGVIPNRLGGETAHFDQTWNDDVGIKRYRIIDMQESEWKMTQVAIFDDDDIRIIEGISKEKIKQLEAAGAVITKRMQRRIRWTVATNNVVLHDNYSPLPFFSVVMFAGYFRSGLTKGMVDNAIDPQQAYNKGMSQYLHTINTTANSGWKIKKNSLTDLDKERLKTQGSRAGFILEFEGDYEPRKIEQNQIPSGLAEWINRSRAAIRDATIPEAARGIQSNEVSGVAIQARQFAAQQQLVVPLNNLSYFRALLGKRLLKMIQMFMTGPRILRVTEMDPSTGQDVQEEIAINQIQEDGSILNDLTIGEYDVVISETPMKSTLDTTEFSQMTELLSLGLQIPPWFVILKSNISNRVEIAEAMRTAVEGAKNQPDPMMEQQLKLMEGQLAKQIAETEKLKAQAVEIKTKAVYAGIQTGGAIAMNSEIADIADQVLVRSGFEERQGEEVFNGVPQDTAPDNYQYVDDGIGGATQNSPMSPNPPQGANTGVETMALD